MAGKRGRWYFGSVRGLPSKRYQARYTGPDSRTYKAPVTFDSQGDADAWLSLPPRGTLLLFPAAHDPGRRMAPGTLYAVYNPVREAAGRPDLRSMTCGIPGPRSPK